MRFFLLLSASYLGFSMLPCHAADRDDTPYTPTLQGPLGLNVVPSARMDKSGTVRASVSTLDPYLHGYLGFQLSEGIHVGLRQTAEASNINEEADRLYPGLDIKFRLVEENRARPEISIGLQSATGHKRMSGEYLALSKRYKDFDFTGGIGWGRYAGEGHLGNPLKPLGHFGKDRDIDGEMPSDPSDWFTGNDVGLFAGVEYFTPLQGLSLKFDWGADRYEAEQAAFNYDAPAPWSAGLSYSPTDWANIGIGIQGTDKIMARLSLKSLISDWRDQAHDVPDTPIMTPRRTGKFVPLNPEGPAQKAHLQLFNTGERDKNVYGHLEIMPGSAAPRQIGRAAQYLSNGASEAAEQISVTPTVMGLRGPTVKMLRRDLEKTIVDKQGSAEEIWRGTEIAESGGFTFRKLKRPGKNFSSAFRNIKLILDNQISLAEEDSGYLYRTAGLLKSKDLSLFGILDSGYGLRLNLHDNLHRLDEYRSPALLPVRSDVARFAERTFAVDELYTAFTHSFRSDLHLSLLGGYMEEMYGGFGGELLYRPYGSRFAFGAEGWQALKRDPYTELNMGFTGDRVLSGFLNSWYDLPESDLTLSAKFGRYLDEDIGGTLGLQKNFKNGAKLEGFVTLTDQNDFDLFGGTTQAHHGVRLTVPLGGYKHIPQGTEARLSAEPFGHDSGQSLQSPLSLYELTEPFSAPHLMRHWEEVAP